MPTRSAQICATDRSDCLGTAALSLGALVAIGLWLLHPLFRVLAQAKAREVMTAAALLDTGNNHTSPHGIALASPSRS
jgi:hypothetical protein